MDHLITLINITANGIFNLLKNNTEKDRNNNLDDLAE